MLYEVAIHKIVNWVEVDSEQDAAEFVIDQIAQGEFVLDSDEVSVKTIDYRVSAAPTPTFTEAEAIMADQGCELCGGLEAADGEAAILHMCQSCFDRRSTWLSWALLYNA